MHARQPFPPDTADYNVISLIDIAFMLIIFLLVTSEFASYDTVENLTLPMALEVRPEQPRPGRLVISVDHEGRIWIGGRVKNLEEVEKALKIEAKLHPSKDPAKVTDQPILIQSDRDVQWQTVQDIMERAARCKFRDISFSAKKEGG